MMPRTSLLVSALLASAAAVGWAVRPAPLAGPVFSHPLDITNVYAPFVPGATKSFEGTDQGATTAVTDDFTGLAANYSDESLRPLWQAWLYSTALPDL